MISSGRAGNDEACMDALQPLLCQLDPLEGFAPDRTPAAALPGQAAAEPGPQGPVSTSVARQVERRLSAVMTSEPHEASRMTARQGPVAMRSTPAAGTAVRQPAEGTDFEEGGCARELAVQHAQAQHCGWRQLQPQCPISSNTTM